MRLLLNTLKLVYHPITNQEGDWLWEDKEVKEYVKNSKLYMIGHREELKFKDAIFIHEDNGIIQFQLSTKSVQSSTIQISVDNCIPKLKPGLPISIEIGEKLFRITESESNDVLLWLTPDKFLYHYWRSDIGIRVIEGEFNLREFTNFELYYVGISKQNDSFSRLFEKAHHGRLKILTNAFSKSPARLSDELVIFLFEIDKMNINMFSTLKDINAFMSYQTEDDIAIVADAEKAFIKLLETQYNEVRYESYPRGTDGLFNEGLDRYGYVIGEDITFYTDTITFNGANDFAEASDMIFIEGEVAKVVKHME
ncbi:hypothetical protein [Paenibacillus sp. LHD-38]|uniref:hypothetical protein n=1 Tax=Paenibacillus sp. LHD-38 TaxID=3072143 RepID=UPI0028107C24|nr:hypothetical protein [Paenibacillus sp. LHD-38]MDQ8734249.1 hypothetical protein [Paenibacillus sp. LHD-38]